MEDSLTEQWNDGALLTDHPADERVVLADVHERPVTHPGFYEVDHGRCFVPRCDTAGEFACETSVPDIQTLSNEVRSILSSVQDEDERNAVRDDPPEPRRELWTQ